MSVRARPLNAKATAWNVYDGKHAITKVRRPRSTAAHAHASFTFL
jgi:hypothetical protein